MLYLLQYDMFGQACRYVGVQTCYKLVQKGGLSIAGRWAVHGGKGLPPSKRWKDRRQEAGQPPPLEPIRLTIRVWLVCVHRCCPRHSTRVGLGDARFALALSRSVATKIRRAPEKPPCCLRASHIPYSHANGAAGERLSVLLLRCRRIGTSAHSCGQGRPGREVLARPRRSGQE